MQRLHSTCLGESIARWYWRHLGIGGPYRSHANARAVGVGKDLSSDWVERRGENPLRLQTPGEIIDVRRELAVLSPAVHFSTDFRWRIQG